MRRVLGRRGRADICHWPGGAGGRGEGVDPARGGGLGGRLEACDEGVEVGAAGAGGGILEVRGAVTCMWSE